jgi:mono/diheme cytochrome c family protein
MMFVKYKIAIMRAAAFIALGLAVSAGARAEEKTDTDAAKNPFEGRQDLVAEGGSLFNQYCSHCHGPNAVQPERVRDLRRLRIRYKEDYAKVFYTTATNGRMDKGMPVWKGVLPDETLWRIFTFLQTVQAEP